MKIVILLAGVADIRFPLHPLSLDGGAVVEGAGARRLLSPFDEAALEVALKLRDARPETRLEVLVLELTGPFLLAGLLAVPVVLLARWVAVGASVWGLRRWREVAAPTVRVLTWGGLRGGISVALALSLPSEVATESVPERRLLLVLTYTVVLFSLLVQAPTVGPLLRRWLAQPAGHRGDEKR